MRKKQTIQLFEEKKVRTVWDEEKEQWFFCVVDVVEALTDSQRVGTTCHPPYCSDCWRASEGKLCTKRRSLPYNSGYPIPQSRTF